MHVVRFIFLLLVLLATCGAATVFPPPLPEFADPAAIKKHLVSIVGGYRLRMQMIDYVTSVHAEDGLIDVDLYFGLLDNIGAVSKELLGNITALHKIIGEEEQAMYQKVDFFFSGRSRIF